MNEIFNFQGQQVRTVTINGEPYFVGKDTADILGYQNGSRDINRHVDEEDKLKYRFGTSGQDREMIIINESGLYALILGSKLPQAKEFKRWVTSEVLPTIRRHGAYLTDSKIEEVLLSPDTIINLATQLKNERAEKEQLKIELEEARKQTSYLDLILQTKDQLTTTQIAQDYGMSASKFNQLLKDLRIQRKVNSQWVLYKQYLGKGYIASRTFEYIGRDDRCHSKITTVWTQLGRKFLYDVLKEREGILPLVEQE
ncbi:phage antirepressor [Streptococcus sanguinis]|uniref:phage antirepressor n=1 Tax=Streptococcus sanguinis TaxID=1305 RepID=UPI001375229B|nr:phage antirepressor [Streptococcus sanguinis]KAF1308103.1 prophage antirepressor [Streptococcus sanguinis OH0843]